MPTRVIILNGPPFSGKDDAAKHLCANYPNFHHREFKAQLFKLTKTIWGITDTEWDFLYTRENKEIPSHMLGGMSPRQALIHTSEVVIKPNYGKEYFGVYAAKTLDPGINVFSDGGFVEEIAPLIRSVGDKILVVRIHRPGHTFKGDSRSYLPDNICKNVVDIHNDGTLEEFFTKIRQVGSEWLLKEF